LVLAPSSLEALYYKLRFCPDSLISKLKALSSKGKLELCSI
jgi:hypothetical protein